MIRFVITTLFVFLCISARTQNSFNFFKESLKKDYININEIPFKKYYLPKYETQNVFSLKKRESLKLFNVYESSLDNMPCLVPNEFVKAHIMIYFPPSVSEYNAAQIPNPYR